jgi:threonine aldolase
MARVSTSVRAPLTMFTYPFYKGLSAVSGATLMDSNEFCSEARIWLRQFGGNLHTVHF